MRTSQWVILLLMVFCTPSLLWLTVALLIDWFEQRGNGNDR